MHSVLRHGFCPRPSDPRKFSDAFACWTRRVRLFRTAVAWDPMVAKVCPKGRSFKAISRRVAHLAVLRVSPLCHFRRVYWAGTHFEKLTSRVSNLALAGSASRDRVGAPREPRRSRQRGRTRERDLLRRGSRLLAFFTFAASDRVIAAGTMALKHGAFSGSRDYVRLC